MSHYLSRSSLICLYLVLGPSMHECVFINVFYKRCTEFSWAIEYVDIQFHYTSVQMNNALRNIAPRTQSRVKADEAQCIIITVIWCISN